jgi:hypothetical protein
MDRLSVITESQSENPIYRQRFKHGRWAEYVACMGGGDENERIVLVWKLEAKEERSYMTRN